MKGEDGYVVPVFFLDTDLHENTPQDKALTHYLYGGDAAYRLSQEKVLGIGGVRMLRNLGFTDIERYHMNEGHASLLTLELMDWEANQAGRSSIEAQDIEAVRAKCVFTTHTPVLAGHDKFPFDLVNRILRRPEMEGMKDVFASDGVLNMTEVALNMSRYVNGVAKKHGEVSRSMFPVRTIDSITNGVHASTWVSPSMQEVFDKHIPGWRRDNYELRYALNIPRRDIGKAHVEAKKKLLEYIRNELGVPMDLETFTVGFARRSTPYKRGDLIFHDRERLKRIAQGGAIQLVFGGKAHPADGGGKEIIHRIHGAARELGDHIKTVYIPDYEMALAKLVTSGVDLWLNTPEPPQEASGTSGMKAALNGVPSLSVLDGWWIEGHVEGVTGWAIGPDPDERPEKADAAKDAASLYAKLEELILPLFYKRKDRYQQVMRSAIALNGSFFNTQRMLQEYVAKAYYL